MQPPAGCAAVKHSPPLPILRFNKQLDQHAFAKIERGRLGGGIEVACVIIAGMNAPAFDAYLLEHRERLLEDYKDFLRQPSVAATGQGITEMAALVARRLSSIGADVKVVPTEGNAPPVVWAELGDGDANS